MSNNFLQGVMDRPWRACFPNPEPDVRRAKAGFGGIMCQILGNELDAATGKTLQRMQPKEFAGKWQTSMAWKFHDPPTARVQGQAGSIAKSNRILSSYLYGRQFLGIGRTSHLPELRKAGVPPENERLLYCPARLSRMRSIHLDRGRQDYGGDALNRVLGQRLHRSPASTSLV
jgi:hypothetical protein